MDNYTGYSRPQNRRIHYLNRIFNEQLKQYGRNILIDGKELKGMVKNNQNPYSETKEDRVLEVSLSVDIYKGSYVKDGSSTYMVITDIDEYEVSKDCKIRKCGCVLKWIDEKGDIQEFPCIVSYQSYGVKIFQANNDFIQETSTNIDVEIPRNSITEKIPLSLRVMFGNSQHGIYKVGDIATYEQGILKLTCKKDKYLKDLDDVENNLPWNGKEETPTPPSTDYVISGNDTIKVNKEYKYTVEPQEGNVTFELDENTVSENIAEIVSTDSYSCVVKALKGNELVTLNVIVNGQVVTSIDISTVRY